ncbi:hypothetical protein GFS60_04606 [Rhodococcus sp. WAY2]|nr:hypothetical protein GFS60_04606 [Rhodococcus sp. WAY2]
MVCRSVLQHVGAAAWDGASVRSVVGVSNSLVPVMVTP